MDTNGHESALTLRGATRRLRVLGHVWVLALVLVFAGGAIRDAGGATRGELMDYGSMLTYTLSEPGKADSEDWPNLTTKAVIIRLGTNAAVAFDTELMRYAAGWTGDFLDLSQTHLTTSKGSLHARIAGDIRFRTRPVPGWSQGGRVEDPRPAWGGSLPKDWAHYRGLYRHGKQVVLHYTVGGRDVWELPEHAQTAAGAFFTRTLRVAPTREPLQVLLCEGIEPDDKQAAASKSASPDGLWAMMNLGESGAVLWAGVTRADGAPREGVAVRVTEDGRIELFLPAGDHPATLKVALWRGLAGVDGHVLANAAAALPWADPMDLCGGGPAQWPETLNTAGRRGFGAGPYVVDAVTVPENNPWGSWMRLLALDFFEDGRAAVSTWNGDVWVVSGLDDSWRSMTWKRYASGLFEGLGLKIVDGVVHVLERHQITRLHDLNGDGEADRYENFNNDAPIGPSYHAFSFGLETDSAGRFYFIRCGQRVDPGLPFNGGMIRVSADGATIEQFAHGLRAANGMSIGPGDTITAADNQGNWVPTSRIDLVEPGKFYGYVPHAHTPEPPEDYEKPLCWIPYTLDNSSGGQIWVEGDRWGLPAGSLLHTSYGKGSLFHVLIDQGSGGVQGAMVPWPLRFESGIMRGRFHPKDGQLYLVGLRGWQTSGGRDGALHRVRHTGKPVRMPLGFEVLKDGVAIAFSEALDPETAADPQNYAVERWDYLWSEAYGSPEFSVAEPGRKGRDTVGIRRVDVGGDGRTARLVLEDFRPAMQMRIQYRVRTASGAVMAGEVYPTIHVLP